jgi:hypothetical protein
MSFSSPLWDRTLTLGDEDEAAKQLDAVLKKYDARRLVVGHTVSPKGILTAAGGRLIRIDVGMCEYYGGPAACLVVEKGTFSEVAHPKRKRKLELEAPATQPAPTLRFSIPKGSQRPGVPTSLRPQRGREARQPFGIPGNCGGSPRPPLSRIRALVKELVGVSSES